MITYVTWLLLYILPLGFLVAVFIKMLADWRRGRSKSEPPRIPTEPVVLMALGFAFLWINAEFVPLVARIAEEQLRMIHPEISLNIVDIAFGVAAVVLMGSFAKAAWTHLNLEEGRWGSIEDYRKNIWPNPILSAFEFWLRVAIAVLVVLLQKQIAALHAIDHIEDARSWSFRTEQESASFLFSYNQWLAQTSLWGLALFGLIGLWLIVAAACNRPLKAIRPPFYRTLTFALPGFLICLSMKYLSTGSVGLSTTSIGQPDFEMIMFLSGFVLFCAFVITCNIIDSLWQAFARTDSPPDKPPPADQGEREADSAAPVNAA
ncbi:MAG TPA: hypothetical protein VEW26_06235 [Allosphingosinicella sp.]|nr:hypothetical protein [Allosphingosinicella sp.]